MTIRFHDWPERFANYLRECRDKEFAWGAHDCVLFAANVVEVLTGVDPAKEVRGVYDDARSALEFIRDGGGLEKLVDAVLESCGLLAVIPPGLAQRGDVVLLRNHRQAPWAGEYALAVVGLDGALLVPAAKGLERLPLDEAAVKAWRI